jgi:hypothetical protein
MRAFPFFVLLPDNVDDDLLQTRVVARGRRQTDRRPALIGEIHLGGAGEGDSSFDNRLRGVSRIVIAEGGRETAVVVDIGRDQERVIGFVFEDFDLFLGEVVGQGARLVDLGAESQIAERRQYENGGCGKEHRGNHQFHQGYAGVPLRRRTGKSGETTNFLQEPPHVVRIPARHGDQKGRPSHFQRSPLI